MKKSIFKIIVIISIIVVFAIITLCLLNYSTNLFSLIDTSRSLDTNYEIDSADITLNVLSDGRINVTEVMRYNPNSVINCVYRESSINDSVLLDGKLKVYYNNQEINENSIESAGGLIFSDNYNIINIKNSSQPFTITYKYTLKDGNIYQYNDLAVFEYKLPANYSKTMKNINITVNLPKSAKKFNIYDENKFGKCSITKISDKSYKVHKDKNEQKNGLFNAPGYTNIKISFDSNIVNTYMKYNYDAPIERIKYEGANSSYQVNYYINIFMLATLLIITIIMLIYYTGIKHMKKDDFEPVKLDYYRDVENILPADLASILINKKFKAKEYIMSSLVMLLNNKEIEISEKSNESIIIIKDLSNITETQKEILKFIFENQVLDVGMSVKMKDINSKFTTNKFLQNIKYLIKKLKNMTTEQLYNLDIYDEFLSSHMRSAKQFAFVNIVFVFASLIIYVVLLLNDLMDFYSVIYLVMLIIVFLLHILGKWFTLDVDKIYQKLLNYISVKTSDKLIYLVATFCVIIIFATKLNLTFIISSIILILNIRIFMFHDDEILSDKGKIEYEKVCGLKKFIEDFSFLNEKEFKDNILWKKYLEYATAFDISKKITNSMSKADLFNFNLVINDIEKIIDIF